MKLYQILICIPAFALAACQTCRIEQPKLTDNRDKQVSVDVAAELDRLNSSGELRTNYRDVVNRTFASMSDDNAALYLLLQAANCAQVHKQPELAKELIAAAREKYRESQSFRTSVSPSSPQLSPAEVKHIDRSPDAPEIKAAFSDAVTPEAATR